MSVLLSNESDLLLKTFDFIGVPVFIIDSNLRVVSLNSTARGVFQYSYDDICGHDLSEITALTPYTCREINDTAQFHSSGFLQEQLSGGVRFESVCKKKNSETFSANITVIPCNNDRKIIVIQDVSHQKKLQLRASQRTKELSIFNTFAHILTRNKTTEGIMKETIAMLLAHMEADRGWIHLIDNETGELQLKTQEGFSPEFENEVKKLKPGECFTGRVFASGRPLLIEKASADPRLVHRDAEIESMTGVPISSMGTVLGVLGIASKNSSFFTSMDAQLLATIGSQLGVAIENARLIAQLQDKMRQIGLINELSSVINSSLSIGTVFRIMASEIRKMIDYDRASLLLFNEKESNLIIFALDTEMKTFMPRGIKAPVEGTSAGWVIRNNRPWINHDLSSELKFPLDKKLFDEGIRSTISIPLFQDKLLGVFNLDSTDIGKYSERDFQILLPVAKHISIALENALLFEEISREKKEWEKTFNAITDMLWTEDSRQLLRRANHALLSNTGFSANEINGKRRCEILGRIGIAEDECLRASDVSRSKPSFIELKGHGGNIFNFWSYPLIDEEGRLYATVHYLKDVTSQKRLEQQLVRTDKLASLGTLVAGIAHEINNPLGIIAGYSEALLDRAGSTTLSAHADFEDFPEYLQTIHNEIFRCKGILRTLLDFARPSGGISREIDINELIKEVILLVNHKAKTLRHNIQLELNREVPKIHAEPGTLRQLFMNILINSMYFTPENGSIVIETNMDGPPDDLRFAAGHGIRVTISDTGSGIDSSIIGRVFDPFFTTKPVGDGTGLGLSICHKIVEEHGGSIDVESTPGKGTTFFIKLPAGDG